jgi:hypothetical protein
MRNTFRRTALVAALLAGTAHFAQAQSQPNRAAVTDPNTRITVFHGTPGEVGNATEVPGYGSSAPPGYTTGAGGTTTVFHGTPAGAPSPWPPPPPPWVPPPPPGSGR